MRFILSILILLSLIGIGGAVLIAPYQINWTQDIDADVSVNGTLSATNIDQAIGILQASHYMMTTFSGGPPGNFTVTGIATSDIIRGASYIDFVNDTTVDILGDCGILDADVIEISPTNTSNGSVILFYYNFEMPS